MLGGDQRELLHATRHEGGHRVRKRPTRGITRHTEPVDLQMVDHAGGIVGPFADGRTRCGLDCP